MRIAGMNIIRDNRYKKCVNKSGNVLLTDRNQPQT